MFKKAIPVFAKDKETEKNYHISGRGRDKAIVFLLGRQRRRKLGGRSDSQRYMKKASEQSDQRVKHHFVPPVCVMLYLMTENAVFCLSAPQKIRECIAIKC